MSENIFDALTDDVYEAYLAHYGVGHLDNGESGRYKWGSGKNPMQRDEFLNHVSKCQNKGWSEKQIADDIGITTSMLRTQLGLSRDIDRRALVGQIRKMRDDGKSLRDIGKELGKNESTIRSLLDENREERMNQARNVAELLKKNVDEKGAIDVGLGVDASLNISREKMKEALYILEMEGYNTYKGRVPQSTNRNVDTTMWVLCPPGTTYPQFYDILKKNEVRRIEETVYSPDGGDTFFDIKHPVSVDLNRVFIKYDEDGGTAKDGLIEIRRGVPDLNLNGKNYAQVRILVNDNKYIKGMACYSDDIPEGYDILVNSNKPKAKGVDKALKDIKDDPDNPFGALIKRTNFYVDDDGIKKQGAINFRAEEGDWGKWADGLPSQFLSKQTTTLMTKQLKLTEKDKAIEYQDILAVDNPVVRKQLLQSFAEDCDAAAVKLKAAALPRQRYHVILPMNTLKDDECYCPFYEDGEKVALIRYPHGGRFEIPIVTVNNSNKEGKKMIGNSPLDALGITKATADRLSGADFDGDTVMAIPLKSADIRNKPPLKELEGFDTKQSYGISDELDRNSMFVYIYEQAKKDKKTDAEIAEDINGDKKLKKYLDASDISVSASNVKDIYKKFKPESISLMHNTQNEMGVISNLITDMTLCGASDEELARAVRHSMVVIDAEKHHLNYKKSEFDNNIAQLKHDYQMHLDKNGVERPGGAGTLISRAKSQESVIKRQGQPKINIEGTEWYDPTRPEGALIYKQADDAIYINYKTGKQETKLRKSVKMLERDDARDLISEKRAPAELIYADYANYMKAMANEARKELYYTPNLQYSPENNKIYSKEVAELKAALNLAKKNKPKERQAQLYSNSKVVAAKEADPKISKDELKKIAQRSLVEGRLKYGASGSSSKIYITDAQWKAIQSGAITHNLLTDIVANADKDRVRDLATPKNKRGLSQAKQNRIMHLKNNGYSLSQIATYTGLSTSTISRYLAEENEASRENALKGDNE